MFDNHLIEDYFLPLDNSPNHSPDELFTSIIPLNSQRLSPLLIYKDNKFLGIISPYSSLSVNRLPPNTKLDAYLINPPAITPQTRVMDAIPHLLSHRLYSLPVFMPKNHQPIGFVSTAHLLQQLFKNQSILNYFSDQLRPDKPDTLPHTATVGEAHTRLRENRATHLLLTDSQGKVEKIVSWEDLLTPLFLPSPRQRFTGRGSRSPNIAFDTEAVQRQDFPLQDYCKPTLNTVSYKTSNSELLKLLLSSTTDYLVLTTPLGKPRGVLTLFTLLKLIEDSQLPSPVPITIPTGSAKLSKTTTLRLIRLLEQFSAKSSFRHSLQDITLHIKSNRILDKRPSIFTLTLQVVHKNGNNYLATTETRQIGRGLNILIDKIERQITEA